MGYGISQTPTLCSILSMTRANQKLSFKYFGPFQVLERVGSVAYRLELPPNSAVHPVIHVSQLMLAAGFKGQVISHLPSDALQYRVPVQVLDKREVARGESRVTQVLVRRSELPED
jgi:hypothetical protein